MNGSKRYVSLVMAISIAGSLFSTVNAAASKRAAWKGETIVDRPISFTVLNKNDSLVDCDSDRKTYTLRGSLVTPASALERQDRAATLWIHGAAFSGEHLWRLRPGGDASFDVGLTMARLGHTFVSVDLVGYGESVSANDPDGTLVCQGSQADVIHQVIDQLGEGSYRLGKKSGPAFGRIALAGLSYGGQFAENVAFSFHNIDALVVMGYVLPPVLTSETAVLLAKWGSRCAFSDHKYEDGSGPAGYHLMPREDLPSVMFNEPEPAAVAELIKLSESDPCGQASSTPAFIATNLLHLAEIKVPVVLANGDRDSLYGPPGPQLHFLRYTGTSDRTLMSFPDAGHIFMLERQRARWLGMIGGWLAGHGF